MREDLWIAVVASVPALIAAYLLGRWDERRQERKARSAITEALRIEIEANLAELEAVWREIHRPVSPQEPAVAPNPLVDIRPAVRLARRSPPRWGRRVWDTSLPQITAALSSEDVMRIRRFYDALAQFDNHLAAMGKPWETPNHNLNLDANAVRAWTEIKALADEMRRGGNSLTSRTD